MMFFIRFMVYFCISFVILAIPINEKTIFNHLYRLTQSLASKKIEVIKNKSKAFFYSKEKHRKNISQERSLSEVSADHEIQGLPSEKTNVVEDSYTDEEREAMRRVLENHRR